VIFNVVGVARFLRIWGCLPHHRRQPDSRVVTVAWSWARDLLLAGCQCGGRPARWARPAAGLFLTLALLAGFVAAGLAGDSQAGARMAGRRSSAAIAWLLGPRFYSTCPWPHDQPPHGMGLSRTVEGFIHAFSPANTTRPTRATSFITRSSSPRNWPTWAGHCG